VATLEKIEKLNPASFEGKYGSVVVFVGLL